MTALSAGAAAVIAATGCAGPMTTMAVGTALLEPRPALLSDSGSGELPLPEPAQPLPLDRLAAGEPTTPDRTLAASHVMEPAPQPKLAHDATAAAPVASPPAEIALARHALSTALPWEDAAAPGSNVSAPLAPPATDQAPLAWNDHLARAIEQLEAQAAAAATADEPLLARLRLLYLAADQPGNAQRAANHLAAAEQEFWTQELHGLSALLESQGTDDQRAAKAATHLRAAASSLGRIGTLQLGNLSFCTAVSSYGVVQKFDRYQFTPGQQVLLYAEVENFTSELTAQGYHTALRAQTELVDRQGRRVDQQQFDSIEENCRNPRRDFFVRFLLKVPPQVSPGEYTLRLTLTDVKSGKAATASLPFAVTRK